MLRVCGFVNRLTDSGNSKGKLGQNVPPVFLMCFFVPHLKRFKMTFLSIWIQLDKKRHTFKLFLRNLYPDFSKYKKGPDTRFSKTAVLPVKVNTDTYCTPSRC